jgi:hypothetical protein
MLTKKENIKNEVKGSKNVKSTSTSSTATPSSHTCCQPITKPAAQTPAKTHTPQPTKQQTDTMTHPTDKKASKTRITVKYDVGYSNQLYIRGKGANLSWDKGHPLKNAKADEWVWETDVPFTHCEFKVLINDRVYENGDNHHLNAGSTLLYTPHFY